MPETIEEGLFAGNGSNIAHWANSVGCGRQAGVAQHCRAAWRESRQRTVSCFCLLCVLQQSADLSDCQFVRHPSGSVLCLCCDCVMIVMEPGDLLTGKSKNYII